MDQVGYKGMAKPLENFLKALTALEESNYKVTTHAYGRIEVQQPDETSVHFVFHVELNRWVMVDTDEAVIFLEDC